MANKIWAFSVVHPTLEENESHKALLLSLKDIHSIFIGEGKIANAYVIKGVIVFDHYIDNEEAALVLGTQDVNAHGNNGAYKDMIRNQFTTTYEITVLDSGHDEISLDSPSSVLVQVPVKREP